jgi:hypothetical protein
MTVGHARNRGSGRMPSLTRPRPSWPYPRRRTSHPMASSRPTGERTSATTVALRSWHTPVGLTAPLRPRIPNPAGRMRPWYGSRESDAVALAQLEQMA